MKRSGQGQVRLFPWIILLCAIFVCIAAFCLQQKADVQYKAVYTLYVTPETEYTAEPERMARECQLLTQTDAFRESVLAVAQSDGKSRMTVKTVENTCVMELAVVGPDAAVVRDLANAAGDELCIRLPLMLPVQDVKTVQRASAVVEADRSVDRVWMFMLTAIVLLAAVLLLCCSGRADEGGIASSDADVFCLGEIHNLKRCMKLWRKKHSRKNGNVLWDFAEQSVLEEIRQLVLRMRVSPRDRCAVSFLMTPLHEKAQDEAVSALVASELAHQGFRVLLMEMTEQTARMEEWLRVQVQRDLHDYLDGRCGATEAMARTDIPALLYMRAHRADREAASFAASAAFADLMKKAKTQFDFVIVHAPPACDTSDAAMLCLNTDAVVFLARDEKCTFEQIRKTAMLFANLHKPARGVVFTGL